MRRALKRGDSPSQRNAASAITIGAAPPMRNTACQPKRGITGAAMKPLAAAPSEKPQIIVVTAAPRRRRGTISEVRAIAFGIAPPIPRPVSSRKSISAGTDSAAAVIREPTPKISTQPISTGRRPIRSASEPLTSAPIIMPTRPLEMTGPRTVGETCSAARKAGAT
jgi:hypothetical protein